VDTNYKEWNERICTICGEHIGSGYDHSECSKIKQEAHADDKRKRRPVKLDKKQTSYLGRYFSGVDH
jgi:hypothetical protein